MNIDGFSLAPLLKELNDKLQGGRIDKIFQPNKYLLVIWIRQLGENLRLIISANPECPSIYLASKIPENPSAPPTFCMLLRKHLQDGRIALITQDSLDRVATLHIDVKNENNEIITKYLKVELMGKHSNILFIENNIIIDAIRHVNAQVSRYRQVLPGKPYISPPANNGTNILIESDNLIPALKTMPEILLSKGIIKNSIGIGPLTANEVIWRAGLPPQILIQDLDDADFISIADAIDSITEPIKQNELIPTAVLDKNKKLIGIAAFPLEHLASNNNVYTFNTMSELIEFLINLERPNIPEKEALKKIIINELSRLKRKAQVIHEDIAIANNADEVRKIADIIMANIYKIKKGQTQVLLPDIFCEDAEANCISVALNPELSPTDNAQNYYIKYHKYKRAQKLLINQLEQCYADINYLESIEVSLENALNTEDINEIRQELMKAGVLKETAKKRSHPLPSQPIKITTEDGFTILIGKNNRQNDLVTFKMSHSTDIWLHTKDIPGSHVIVHTQGQPLSNEILLKAASLAAYYSKARNSLNVPVDYTIKKYVKKPSGAKPGFVIYDHQTTIYVTPQEK